MLERLDLWLAIITLGLLAYFEGRKYLAPIVRPIVRLFSAPASHSPVRSHSLRRRVPIRRPDGKLNGSVSVAETSRNGAETHFDDVSAIATPKDDPEMIAFRFLARLIKAGMLTETQALEGACEVKAGSSKAYQEARGKLKKALEVMENKP